MRESNRSSRRDFSCSIPGWDGLFSLGAIIVCGCGLETGFAHHTARQAGRVHGAVTAPCGDPSDLLVTQDGDIWRGEMFFLWRGVNTAQMCSAVMRSDFIHEDTQDQSLLIVQGGKESSESKSPQILKDYSHGNQINLIIFMNICAARGRQPRSFACVGKSDKRTDALWYLWTPDVEQTIKHKRGGIWKP